MGSPVINLPINGLYPLELQKRHFMETDLDKAREIVKSHVRYIERMGLMHENVAIAVAEGIALGRKEGIGMAAEAVARLSENNG
jgi:hypothetical protein